MPRFEAIPHRVHRNLINGREASIFGALPYSSAGDAQNWRVVQKGWTVRDTVNNTTGVYACPAGSSEIHAKAVADVLNGMHKMPGL